MVGNVVLKQRSAVPRHREIPDFLTKKICRDLGISAPGETDEEGEPDAGSDGGSGPAA